jgi:hypothetical protein
MKNYLDVGNVEIGVAVGVYFGAKSRRRVRIPTANKSMFMTVVIDTSLQDNRMAFRVFDPMGTEFAIIALQGTDPKQLATAVRVYRRKHG